MGLLFSGVILPVSVAVQLAALFLFPSDRFTNMDSFEYLALSRSISTDHQYSAPSGLNGYQSFQGESPTVMRQPGYPVLLAVFYWLCGQHLLCIQILQVAFNCLSLTFLFLTVRGTDEKDNPWVLLFPALYVPWLVLSSMILAESLFTALLWASVYLLSGALRTGKMKFHLLLGLTLGAGVLVKPVGVVMAVLSLACLFAVNRKMLKVSLTGLTVLLVLMPWALRNMEAVHRLTIFPTTSGYNLWIASRPIGSEWWDESEEFREATGDWDHYYIDGEACRDFRHTAMGRFRNDGILTVAGRALARTVIGWTRFPGTGDLSGWNAEYLFMTAIRITMLVFSAVGFFRLQMKHRWLLILPAVALSFALPVTKGLTRYLLPASPGIALLAGQGVLSLIRRRT